MFEIDYEQLKESKDGFAYVTDCFNKDLFKETEEEIEEPEMNEMKEEVHPDEINEDEIPIQVLDLQMCLFETNI